MQQGESGFSCEECGSGDLKITGVARGRTVVRCGSCGRTATIFECGASDADASAEEALRRLRAIPQ